MPENTAAAIGLVSAGATISFGALSLLSAGRPWLQWVAVGLVNLGFVVSVLGAVSLASPGCSWLSRHAHAILILSCTVVTIVINASMLVRL